MMVGDIHHLSDLGLRLIVGPPLSSLVIFGILENPLQHAILSADVVAFDTSRHVTGVCRGDPERRATSLQYDRRYSSPFRLKLRRFGAPPVRNSAILGTLRNPPQQSTPSSSNVTFDSNIGTCHGNTELLRQCLLAKREEVAPVDALAV